MKYGRKAVLFILDGILLLASAWGSFSLMHETIWPTVSDINRIAPHLGVMLICAVAVRTLFGEGKMRWGQAKCGAYLRFIFTELFGIGLYVFICQELLLRDPLETTLLIPMFSAWILEMLVIRLMLGVRSAPVSMVIIGTGNTGEPLLRELKKASSPGYRVRGFLDDAVTGCRRVSGVKVLRKMTGITTWLTKKEISDVLINLPALTAEARPKVLREVLEAGNLHVKVLPTDFDTNQPLLTQLRPPELEDFLGRDPIQLDSEKIRAGLAGKVVLVTGGGGSVGSELCRQIVKYHPAKLIVVDNYENNAYLLQQELQRSHGKELDLSIEIASIREKSRIRQIFMKYRPQIVFHAAAHKHVPLMESAPEEAIRNNVFGTWNLVCAAEAFCVEKFVLVSSDKAVDPSSVMGASKRLCEMMMQSCGSHGATTFATVRFGNVLESNGSVVPVFRRQIAAGGPVTLMDRQMTRYFMTLPEAAQLVLAAGAMAKQNEIYVLNMGQPVQIRDLAEDLIRLSGLHPYQDIDIVEIGMRPGDKMHEELFAAGCHVEKTENAQILIERQPRISPQEMRDKLTILTVALASNDSNAIRKALYETVPTYHEPRVTTGTLKLC